MMQCNDSDDLPVVVWRCPRCRLLSEDGGTQPHREGCAMAGESGLVLEPAYRGKRAALPGQEHRGERP